MAISLTDVQGGVSEARIGSILRDFAVANSLLVNRHSDPLRQPERMPIDTNRVGRVVDFVESEFGVYVSPDEITEANFGSVNELARFVAARQSFAVG